MVAHPCATHRLSKNGVFQQPVKWTAILYLLLTLPAMAADKTAYLSLKMKDEVLMKEMTSGKTIMLPEFGIYDTEGFRIYHSIGLPDSFQKDVQAALAGNKREDGKLSDIQANMVHMDGSPFTDDSLKEADFVFVEYWAEWCSACLKQMKQVADIIGNAPERKIRWLKVEKDPAKLDGAGITGEKHH